MMVMNTLNFYYIYLEHYCTCNYCESGKHDIVNWWDNCCIESVQCLVEREQKEIYKTHAFYYGEMIPH